MKTVTIDEGAARELHELANSVMRDLRIRMPDEGGAIRLELLSVHERAAYDLARAALLALAPWVLKSRPARQGGR